MYYKDNQNVTCTKTLMNEHEEGLMTHILHIAHELDLNETNMHSYQHSKLNAD